MKRILLILLLLYCSSSFAGDRAITTKFGNGTLTRWSNGDKMITQKFGNGTITRYGRKTYITMPYGKGTITRSYHR